MGEASQHLDVQVQPATRGIGIGCVAESCLRWRLRLKFATGDGGAESGGGHVSMGLWQDDSAKGGIP